MRKARNTVCALLVALLALVSLFAVLVTASQPSGSENEPREVLGASEGYKATAADMQMPELPTGCEATAMATLLRLNGVDASKTDVADAMPKSATDFVHAFWGDPRSQNGGCCMAPCAAETARTFLTGTGLEAYETEGRGLHEIPYPCVAWVTVDLADPQGPIRTQGAYDMYYPSHCVTVLGISGDTVKTIDPLKGLADYPLDRFERIYKTLGAQAVRIGEE